MAATGAIPSPVPPFTMTPASSASETNRKCKPASACYAYQPTQPHNNPYINPGYPPQQQQPQQMYMPPQNQPQQMQQAPMYMNYGAAPQYGQQPQGYPPAGSNYGTPPPVPPQYAPSPAPQYQYNPNAGYPQQQQQQQMQQQQQLGGVPPQRPPRAGPGPAPAPAPAHMTEAELNAKVNRICEMGFDRSDRGAVTSIRG